MRITLKLILNELGYEYEGNTSEQENPTFACVELLAAHGADLSGQSLLVCPLSEALTLTGRTQGLHFLCVRDRVVDAMESLEAMRGIVVIRKNLSMRELFNETQRIFVRISNWIIDMHRSVMRNEGIQALITLSEPIIGNHIAVMDPTFKLMAYTKNVETDDPVSNALVQHGYHPLETVERFKLHRRFEQFEKADGIIVSEDFVTSEYVTVKKVFRCRNSYSVLVVMVCCAKALSDGLLDLFKLLMENLQIYVDRDYPPEGNFGPVNALVCDLLDAKVVSMDEVQKRAHYAGLSFRAQYDLFLLHFDDTLNVPIGRLVRDLEDLLLFSHVLSYQRSILILNHYDGERMPDRAARLVQVNTVIGSLTAACGISSLFSDLCELPTAHEQASVAIRTGTQLRGKPNNHADSDTQCKCYDFEDYVLYRLIAMGLSESPDVFKNSFFYRAIQTLTEYERKHNTKVLQLMYTYLQCERRATETCTRLHMHRNTVLYHIKRIEEILNISLEDPEIRLKLMLGFKLRELNQSGSTGEA
ncbi:MAG: helix-turn-helix domain-containing protein [Oscillospiraceae bacterium]|nr:helix-turn-helix domain-containing protein [Oscillospiraceae bacterium]